MNPKNAATLFCALALAAACKKAPEDRTADWIEKLKSPDAAVSGPAGLELLNIGEPAVPSIAALLKDAEPRVRRAAATTLWAFGPRMAVAVPALAEALADPEVEVRRSAAMALESAGAEAAPAVPALAKALRDKDGGVRLYSVKALGAIGPPARAAIPALKDASRGDFGGGAADDALRKIQGGP